MLTMSMPRFRRLWSAAVVAFEQRQDRRCLRILSICSRHGRDAARSTAEDFARLVRRVRLIEARIPQPIQMSSAELDRLRGDDPGPEAILLELEDEKRGYRSERRAILTLIRRGQRQKAIERLFWLESESLPAAVKWASKKLAELGEDR